MIDTVILTPGEGFPCAVRKEEVTPPVFFLVALNSSWFSDKSTMTL